jgi:pimeloyl-ACP methyl ester carboxylesterase
MPKVRVGDIQMHYVEAGAGEPLVLIMGLGGDHLAWGFQIPAFARSHRVIVFDNRGAGETDQPDRPYTIKLMAEDTVGLLDALGIDRVHLAGASMGGMIAQEVALNHSHRVRSLQLHCTLARPDAYLRALTQTWRNVRSELSREASLRAIAVWLFAPETWNARPELVEMVIQTGLATPHPQTLTGFLRQTEAVLGHDTLERLREIRCPTLVSVADEDIMVPPRFAREIAARVAGAEFRTIPGAGHLYFMEVPELFNAMCLDFLRKAGDR